MIGCDVTHARRGAADRGQRDFPPSSSAILRPMLLRPRTDFMEPCLDHGIHVDNVDNFPQVSAATAETSLYFFGEFLNELGTLIFTTYCLFASRVFSLGLYSDRARHSKARRATQCRA